MKILWITARFPLPPIKGDRLRAFHLLKRLARRHEIDLASFSRPEDLPHIDEMRGIVRSLDLVPFRAAPQALRMLPFVPTGVPFQVGLHRHPAMARIVRERLRERGHDAIVCMMLRSTVNLPPVPPCPMVADFVDSMTLNFANRLAKESGPMKAVVAEEVRRLRRHEPEQARRFAAVMVVSERDRQAIGGDNVRVVPMGVDTQQFAPSGAARSPRKIVFTGNLGYFPNVDAATWFAREILPRVRSEVPDAEFEIAGVGARKAVLDLDGLPGVRVVGFVEDMAAFIDTAAVAVCPMRSGSGMQIKMMEAMACAVPVVASSYAAEGIPARAGRDFLLADGADAFAAEVRELLRSPERAKAVGQSGREFIARHASWDAAADSLESLLQEAVAKRR